MAVSTTSPNHPPETAELILDLHLLKTALLSPLYVHGVARTLSSLTGSHASIFMLHRFFCRERGVEGHDPSVIRAILSTLRREQFSLVSLREIFRRLKEGRPLGRAVAFTIDDGYFDHAQVAAPIFEEFGCPLTMFLVSGFMDGKLWLWWDQVQYIFENTPHRVLEITVGEDTFRYELESLAARDRAAHDLSSWYQRTADGDVATFVASLAEMADVEVPGRAPERFAPLSWDEARALERRGIDFGIHTVSHPRLAGLTKEMSAWEIEACWKRLREELSDPLPVLCYPFGKGTDFGTREVSFVSQMHLAGAVTASSGNLSEHYDSEELCALPRYPTQNDILNVLQCSTGLETIKSWIRRHNG